MTDLTYPFIDLAVHDAIGQRYVNGEALIVTTVDFDKTLWANGVATSLLGHDTIYGFMDGDFVDDQDIKNNLIAIVDQLGKNSLMRNASLNLDARSFGQDLKGNIDISLEPIKLPKGEEAVLVILHPKDAIEIEEDQTEHIIAGFADEDTPVAVLSSDGDVLDSTKSFKSLKIKLHSRLELIEAVSHEDDRLVKRHVDTKKGSVPTAIGVLSQSPELYLIFGITPHEDEQPKSALQDESVTPASEPELSALEAIAALKQKAIDEDLPEDISDDVYDETRLSDEPINAGDEDLQDIPPLSDDTLSSDKQFMFQPRDRAVRFVWRTDAAGLFTEVSPELTEVVGENATDIIGRRFSDVAQVFNLANSDEIVDLIQRRDTWSGKTVMWPVQGEKLSVPIDLAALPTYTRDRLFDGYRGFGIARVQDVVDDPNSVGPVLVPGPYVSPYDDFEDHNLDLIAQDEDVGLEDAQTASSGPDPDKLIDTGVISEWNDPSEEQNLLEQAYIDGKSPENEVSSEVSAVELTETPGRRQTDKILKLEELRQQSLEGLSKGEAAAFAEIGAHLSQFDDDDDDASKQIDENDDTIDSSSEQDIEANDEPVDAVSSTVAPSLPELPQLDDDTASALTQRLVNYFSSSYSAQSSNEASNAIDDHNADTDTRNDRVIEDNIELSPELLGATSIGAGLLAASLAKAASSTQSEPEEASPTSEDVEDHALEIQEPEKQASENSAQDDNIDQVGDKNLTTGTDEPSGNLSTSSDDQSSSDQSATILDNNVPNSDAEARKSDGTSAESSNHDAENTASLASAATPTVNRSLASRLRGFFGREQRQSGIDESDASSKQDAQSAAPPIETAPAEPKPDDTEIANDATSDQTNVDKDESITESQIQPSNNDIVDDAVTPDQQSEADAAEPVLEMSDPDDEAELLQLSSNQEEQADHAADVQDSVDQDDDQLSSSEATHIAEQYVAQSSNDISDITDFDDVSTDQEADLFDTQKDSAASQNLMADTPPIAAKERGDATSSSEGELNGGLQTEIDELKSMLDMASDGIVIINGDTTIRSMSNSAKHLFGYDDDETISQPFAKLFAQESQNSIVEYLQSMGDHGVASILNSGREITGRRASGETVPLFMTLGHMSRHNGYCAVLRDITQSKRVAKELQDAKDQAETANAHKTEFLTRVSHEIRTPLNAIIGFSDMLRDEKLGALGHPRYGEYAHDIGKSGRHVLDIVNDLLNISKIEAGQQEMDFIAVSLNNEITEIISLLQPMANERRVIVRSSFDKTLPDVVADQRSIKQILLNLMSNALRFTEAGGQVVISTSLEADGSVLLRLRDSGIGMSKEDLERAMQPFGQVQSDTQKSSEGTGLGLPITRAMTEANRAKFEIVSASGDGTLVTIRFPSQRVLAE